MKLWENVKLCEYVKLGSLPVNPVQVPSDLCVNVKLGFHDELHECENAETDAADATLTGENGNNTRKQTAKINAETTTRLPTTFTHSQLQDAIRHVVAVKGMWIR